MMNHIEDASSTSKSAITERIVIVCGFISFALCCWTLEAVALGPLRAIGTVTLLSILRCSALVMISSIAFMYHINRKLYARSPKALEDKLKAAALSCEHRADRLLRKYLGNASPLSQKDRELEAKHIHETTCLLIAMGENPYELPVDWSMAAKEVVEEIRASGLWNPVPYSNAKKSDLVNSLRISRLFLSLAVRYLSQENCSRTFKDFLKFFVCEGDQIDVSSCLSDEHSTARCTHGISIMP